MNEKLIRTFLAAELPSDKKEHMIRIQEHMKRKLAGFRWVRPEGIHLTLKFFGYIGTADIVRIEEIIRRHTEKASPMAFMLSEVGGFPSLTHPRVIWVGLEGDIEHLRQLQKNIETDLGNKGFPREKKKFSPHLTLARVKSPGGKIDGLEDSLKGIRKFRTRSFNVAELVLFKSDLAPDGAVHTALARFPMGGTSR
ncbi:MAG: RNA 2',3'-cyclic phosphodiesterase [Syntrophales bacterium]|jgi:2'-5' RNA ligase|nr:RNA 2',3'-cyclic phosphodiesterase [Syntrophales bacterium]MDY0043570.1 RNA 2',3'-cyclic phosphodiesterase [Syntrophales bacterium]